LESIPIDYVAAILEEKRVRATWFITHASLAVDKLLQKPDLFEIGIHPNCLKGSTQGRTEDEVLKYLKGIVPHARSMRTHSLYQSTPFLVNAAKHYGIDIDCSLFLPRTPFIKSHCLRLQGIALRRIPYFWEDDAEMYEMDPIWNLSDLALHADGLKVFDFHPVHIVLNTQNFDVYRRLRDEKSVAEWDAKFVEMHVQDGAGPKTFFVDLVDRLSVDGGKTISQLIDEQ
jgi:hypothetical protein